MLLKLYGELSRQADGLPVEILAFTDNKKRSIGLKRDALVQIATGKYVSFVDDDDETYPCYVAEMLAGCESGADVISTVQHASLNGDNKFVVNFGIDNDNEQAYAIDGIWQDIKRKPFHTCAWKSEIAKKYHFPDIGYGEDWLWCEQLLRDVKTEHKINIPIMCYRWDEGVTEADNEPKEGKE
jgi:hypothetical protein